MPTVHAGDLLCRRYRVTDLLSEAWGGSFWRAQDEVLGRPVALQLLPVEDERAPGLLRAARAAAGLPDRRVLRVLDADEYDGTAYVVNEWGEGISLDVVLATEGALAARRAAWICAEVAASVATAHDHDLTHGRLTPENVLIDLSGSVRIIGYAVEAALHGLTDVEPEHDVTDLAALVYAGLTERWAGVSSSGLPAAPTEHGAPLRPRRVRAGIPRPLDQLCDHVLGSGGSGPTGYDLTTARGIGDMLAEFVGDPSGMAAAEAARLRATGALPRVQPDERGRPEESEPPTDVLPGAAVAAGAAGTTAAAGAAAGTGAGGEPGAAGDPEATDEISPAGDTDQTGDAGEVDDPEATGEISAVGGTDQTGDSGDSNDEGDRRDTSDVPTEAGLPIFHEDDELSWLSAEDARPPEPVPAPPPERPLFAPDPPPGEPVRRPKSGVGGATGSAAGPPSATPPHAGQGPPLPPEESPAEEEQVPGRSWLRLAGGVAVAALVLLALAFSVQLGQGGAPLGLGGNDESPSPPGSSVPAPQRVADLVAEDVDPQGDTQQENPDLTGLAVDRDLDTAWRTKRYFQDFGPGGLKTGVGLTVDLGKVRRVQQVVLRLNGTPTSYEVYLTDSRPDDLTTLTPLDAVTAQEERSALRLGRPRAGRYVTIWLTSLPAVEGGYRAEIAEVVVRG